MDNWGNSEKELRVNSENLAPLDFFNILQSLQN